MKNQICWVALVIVLLAASVSKIIFWQNYRANSWTDDFADLYLRYGESRCAHTGVNPFHVWNGDVKNVGFKAWERPDLNQEDVMEDALPVVAYPPWHVTYTWPYGYVRFSSVVCWMYFMCGICLLALYIKIKKIHVVHGISAWMYFAIISFFIAEPVASCLLIKNYGILLSGALLAMLFFLERGNQICAGLCWALIMSKPQVGVLLFFPLLFQKKYVTIFTAVSTCFIATLWPAYIYKESPIELIMQIPRFGEPYNASFSSLKSILPDWCIYAIRYLRMGIFACLCGYFSWSWSRSRANIVFKYAPFALAFQYWTYINRHDFVVAWPLFVLLAVAFTQQIMQKGKWRINAYCFLLFMAILSFAQDLGRMGMFGMYSNTINSTSFYVFRILLLLQSCVVMFLGRRVVDDEEQKSPMFDCRKRMAK